MRLATMPGHRVCVIRIAVLSMILLFTVNLTIARHPIMKFSATVFHLMGHCAFTHLAGSMMMMMMMMIMSIARL